MQVNLATSCALGKALMSRKHEDKMNVSPLLSASFAIQIHVIGVFTAIIATALIFTRARGSYQHRLFGWMWVAGMGTAALSSFFITAINKTGFSLIHVLSVWVIFSLFSGIYAIRVHRSIRGHRQAMLGMTIGGLGVAGALSFLPGRIMLQVVTGV